MEQETVEVARSWTMICLCQNEIDPALHRLPQMS